MFVGLIFSSSNIYSQSLTRYTILNGDTIPVVDLPLITIGTDYSKPPKFRNKRESRKYRRMKRYVKKVYPYAQLASQKLNECYVEINADSTSKRKAMRKVEKALKAEYGDELKKLTMTQGKILLLLIDRQTGNTTFELVKELRGNFSASMYQGVARIFGSSLKVNYEPNGKDWMIEDIVKKIEIGLI